MGVSGELIYFANSVEAVGRVLPAKPTILPLWSDRGKIILPRNLSKALPSLATIRPSLSKSWFEYFFFSTKNLVRTLGTLGEKPSWKAFIVSRFIPLSFKR